MTHVPGGEGKLLSSYGLSGRGRGNSAVDPGSAMPKKSALAKTNVRKHRA